MAINKDVLLSMVQQTKVELPYSKTKVQLRAFLVKEMKLLLMASENLETKGDKSYIEVISQIIKNCVVSPADLDIDNLPIFEIELLYTHLWMLSKGESVIPVTFRCVNEIKISEVQKHICDTEINTLINLKTAKISETIDPEIKLNDQMSITMRYPTLAELSYYDLNSETDIFNLICRCIDVITIQGESGKVGTDYSFDEVSEILEYLTSESLEKMTHFIDNLPSMQIALVLKCPSCGHEEPILLKGIEDFFL